jgi:hypothetical protein
MRRHRDPAYDTGTVRGALLHAGPHVQGRAGAQSADRAGVRQLRDDVEDRAGRAGGHRRGEDDEMSGIYLPVAGVAALLAVVGFVLAATVSPGAINMGVGMGIGAVLMGVIGFVDWIRGD